VRTAYSVHPSTKSMRAPGLLPQGVVRMVIQEHTW
jgi:hypothetical protein